MEPLCLSGLKQERRSGTEPLHLSGFRSESVGLGRTAAPVRFEARASAWDGPLHLSSLKRERRLRWGPPCPGGLAHRSAPPSMAPTSDRRPSLACLRQTPRARRPSVASRSWLRSEKANPRDPGFRRAGLAPLLLTGKGNSSGASPALRGQVKSKRRHARKGADPGTEPRPQSAERRGSPGVWRKQHRDVLRSAVGGRTPEPADAPYPRTAAAPAEANATQRLCSCGCGCGCGCGHLQRHIARAPCRPPLIPRRWPSATAPGRPSPAPRLHPHRRHRPAPRPAHCRPPRRRHRRPSPPHWPHP